MKYKKEPLIIEAKQWNGQWESGPNGVGADDITIWCMSRNCTYMNTNGAHCLTIRTLEGEMKVTRGDYIIKGIKGEFYLCKPDIFEATYTPFAKVGD